jgi:hypothetical protein
LLQSKSSGASSREAIVAAFPASLFGRFAGIFAPVHAVSHPNQPYPLRTRMQILAGDDAMLRGGSIPRAIMLAAQGSLITAKCLYDRLSKRFFHVEFTKGVYCRLINHAQGGIQMQQHQNRALPLPPLRA